jgi:hypothetical protein
MSTQAAFAFIGERSARRCALLLASIACLVTAIFGVAFVIAARSSQPTHTQAMRADTSIFRNASAADALCANEYRHYMSLGGDGAAAFYACVDYYSNRVVNGDQVRLK